MADALSTVATTIQKFQSPVGEWNYSLSNEFLTCSCNAQTCDSCVCTAKIVDVQLPGDGYVSTIKSNDGSTYTPQGNVLTVTTTSTSAYVAVTVIPALLALLVLLLLVLLGIVKRNLSLKLARKRLYDDADLYHYEMSFGLDKSALFSHGSGRNDSTVNPLYQDQLLNGKQETSITVSDSGIDIFKPSMEDDVFHDFADNIESMEIDDMKTVAGITDEILNDIAIDLPSIIDQFSGQFAEDPANEGDEQTTKAQAEIMSKLANIKSNVDKMQATGSEEDVSSFSELALSLYNDHCEVERMIEDYEASQVTKAETQFLKTLQEVSGHVKLAIGTVLAAAEFKCDVKAQWVIKGAKQGRSAQDMSDLREIIAQKRSELRKVSEADTVKQKPRVQDDEEDSYVKHIMNAKRKLRKVRRKSLLEIQAEETQTFRAQTPTRKSGTKSISMLSIMLALSSIAIASTDHSRDTLVGKKDLCLATCQYVSGLQDSFASSCDCTRRCDMYIKDGNSVIPGLKFVINYNETQTSNGNSDQTSIDPKEIIVVSRPPASSPPPPVSITLQR